MSDVLVKIKCLVLKGHYKFSEKASLEMEADGITEFHVVESILNMSKLIFRPTCGSKKIKQVRQNLIRNFRGQAYVVPDLEYHECPDCGERVYDPQAMRKSKRILRRMRKNGEGKKRHNGNAQ